MEGGRGWLEYDSNDGDIIKYPIWLLERKCQKIFCSVVFIRPFTGSSYYVSSYTDGTWMGIIDVSYVSRSIFHWAILRSHVASTLGKIDTCE